MIHKLDNRFLALALVLCLASFPCGSYGDDNKVFESEEVDAQRAQRARLIAQRSLPTEIAWLTWDEAAKHAKTFACLSLPSVLLALLVSFLVSSLFLIRFLHCMTEEIGT